MKLGPIFTLILTMVVLVAITGVTLLYAEGWRINPKTVTVQKTGMLAIRSTPEGAKVFINKKIVTATNDTVQSLTPGNYVIEVKKDGYESWQKDIEIFPELVTDITAVLISQSPRIEPLTSTGVVSFAMSSSLDKIAYTTKNAQRPGLWIIPLAGSTLNIFKTNPNLIAEDTLERGYSNAEEILWSPDDSEILLKMNEKGYYLIDLQKNTEPKELLTKDEVVREWEIERLKRTNLLVERQKLEPALKEEALKGATTWSPDEKKFLYSKEYGDLVEIHVQNMEDPLPVGESKQYVALRIKKASLRSIAWYSDSYHLVILEDKSVFMVRVDGTNKTEVFSANGNLASDKVFVSPWGDKVILLASFKQNSLPDLYTVGIR